MKKLLLLMSIILLGCTTKPTAPTIALSIINNGNSLKISGLNNQITEDIARDTSNHFESLVPVFRMPADTDMKDFQPVQPGQYKVTGGVLLFTPDTPFVKQQAYFVRYYQYSESNSVWDFVKGRKSAKKLPYTDLIFKQ